MIPDVLKRVVRGGRPTAPEGAMRSILVDEAERTIATCERGLEVATEREKAARDEVSQSDHRATAARLRGQELPRLNGQEHGAAEARQLMERGRERDQARRVLELARARLAEVKQKAPAEEIAEVQREFCECMAKLEAAAGAYIDTITPLLASRARGVALLGANHEIASVPTTVLQQTAVLIRTFMESPIVANKRYLS